MKVIRGSAAADADRWQVPAIDASPARELAGASRGSAHLLTAGQLDELQRRVQQEGFEQGLAEGREEVGRRVARVAALMDALVYPFEVLDETVEEALATLAIALASHIVRREIEHDRTLLVAMVRECLGALPAGAREVVMYLNAEDAALVTGHLEPDASRAWTIKVDPGLEPGDLRVASDSSQIDGRLGVRLAAILATMAGEAEQSAGEDPRP